MTASKRIKALRRGEKCARVKEAFSSGVVARCPGSQDYLLPRGRRKGRLRREGKAASEGTTRASNHTSPHTRLFGASTDPIILSLVKKSDSAKCRAPNPLQGRITRAAGVLSKHRVGRAVFYQGISSYLIRRNVRHQGSGMLSAE